MLNNILLVLYNDKKEARKEASIIKHLNEKSQTFEVINNSIDFKDLLEYKKIVLVGDIEISNIDSTLIKEKEIFKINPKNNKKYVFN
jgi:hypothetical protein